MKLGKWYIMFNIGDLYFGIGRPPATLVRSLIDPSRPHSKNLRGLGSEASESE
jgi:hypothetical protein